MNWINLLIKIIKILIFLFIDFSAFSQGEIDEQQKIFYRNERTVGVLLNSNGYGLDYRFGKWENAFNKYIYEVGISSIYNPKEYKTKTSSYTNPMKYGKLNNLYVLHTGYGMQKRMFKKIDKGGVSIKSIYSFGPSIGLLKPIYYIYEVPTLINGNYYYTYVSNTFDEAAHNFNDPIDKDAFTKGISKTKILPGAFFKYGINFEYSTVDDLIHALEIGIVFDGFLIKAPIIADLPANHIFFTMYISYRFGKIVNAIY